MKTFRVIFLLVSISPSAFSATNLIQNGSFETPAISYWYLLYGTGSIGITGWTVINAGAYRAPTGRTDTSSPAVDITRNSPDNVFSSSLLDGSNWQYLDIGGYDWYNMGLQSSLIAVTPGQQYTLSFDLGSTLTYGERFVSNIGVSITNTTDFTSERVFYNATTNLNPAPYDNGSGTLWNRTEWKTFNITWTAKSNTTQISFIGRNPGTSIPPLAGYPDNAYDAPFLDNVILTSNANSVDTTPPTITMTAPTNGNTVSGASVKVSANTTDNVGVSGVQFKLDGANLGIEDASSPYSVVWNSKTASKGSHTLTAVARDVAGNVTTSAGVIVKVR